MSDPLRKYIVNKLVEDFQSNLDRLLVEHLKIAEKSGEGPSAYIVAGFSKGMLSAAIHLILMTHPRSPVDTSDNASLEKLVAKYSMKYLTLLSNDIDPEGWEMLKREYPERAKEIEEMIK